MACEQFGRSAEKPVSGRLMLRIAPNVHAAAQGGQNPYCLG